MDINSCEVEIDLTKRNSPSFKKDQKDSEVSSSKQDQHAFKQSKTVQVKSTYLDPLINKFDLNILQSSFPEGVQPDKKEAYLRPEVFEETFGMTYKEFYSLKLWKQRRLKKDKKLF